MQMRTFVMAIFYQYKSFAGIPPYPKVFQELEKYSERISTLVLYLSQKNVKDAHSNIIADEPKVMELTIVSFLITSDKISEMIEEGFETPANDTTSSLRFRIKQSNSFLKVKSRKVMPFSCAMNPEKVQYY